MRKIRSIIHITFIVIFCFCQNNLSAQASQKSKNEERWHKWRDEMVQPEKLLNRLEIKPGMIIGEAGAGAGYFTYYLAERVKETGHVYANDILTLPLENLKKQLTDRGLKNYTTVLGEADDPLFPVKNLDMIISLSAWHEFTNKVEWLRNSRKYLKPGSSVIILDSRDDNGREITKEDVSDDANKAGYSLKSYEEYNSEIKIFILKPKS